MKGYESKKYSVKKNINIRDGNLLLNYMLLYEGSRVDSSYYEIIF